MELTQLTVRIPHTTRERIENLAKKNSCSVAEVVRLAVDDKLDSFLDNIQYVDAEQGKQIIRLLSGVYEEIASIRIELRRIGTNYNQEIKLRHLTNQYAEHQISMPELIRGQDAIRKECKDFSLEDMNRIMDRYERISEEVRKVCAIQELHTHVMAKQP
ncbi:MAG: hypothetical protein Q4D54_08440 [Eubacteriales bacterium]|nr:hypothetical protein [Eubacteriales bacterium]